MTKMERYQTGILAILPISLALLVALQAPTMVYLGVAPLTLMLFALMAINLKRSWQRNKSNDIADLLKREIDTVSFISAHRLKELITLETVSSVLLDLKDREMISEIVHRAPRLFASLVLIDKPEYIQKLLELKVDDELFRYLKPKSPIRTPKWLFDLSEIGPENFQEDLYNVHGRLPFPFQSEGHPVVYDQSYVFPYKSTEHIGSGSFGSVSKVNVAGGHLRGYFSVRAL